MAKKKSEKILPTKKNDSSKTKKKKSNFHLPKAKNSKKTAKRKTNMNLYSSLAYKHRSKVEANSRRRAEELSKLPKNPVKRFFARLAPKRVFKWWFSWRGQKAILKFFAACFLLGIIGLGVLFMVYRKELEEVDLTTLNIETTVNRYYDRNGELLWEDTGDSDYRMVVDNFDEIPEYLKQATIAIEDKNFYNHKGVDFGALIRAAFSTLSGKGVQGGSTLTQQLIKQIYFSDEAASENRGGIQRKIKELILALELEKKYSKDDILFMYLNQSPYGGRRNGVESAAETYFNKTVKDLNLAECALLAAIPNNPSMYNPYNEYYSEALIERQHKVLDDMKEMGYITEQEANDAKNYDILATIQPESSQYANMKAPHFVLEVKKQLENKYGASTMRAGGWTIKTTLDLRAQQIAEDAVDVGEAHMYKNSSDDLAMVSVDVETSQVIAMVGSVDFYNTSYGETNATTDSWIEPGSSIKPILDYTPLFMQREGVNYGPGSILKDENIDRIYCAGYVGGGCTLGNATGTFYGNVTIRFSLGHSLNIAAVKALYINGIDNSLEVAHNLGDASFCSNVENPGLSIAIGSGCGVKMVEHANAYASLARGGAYKDLSYILELKNNDGEVIESWTDPQATQVVDPQVAYMISSILSDHSARWFNNEGFVVPNVWTATKTGTTTTTNSAVTKDSLIESYSTAVSTFVWNGNHDGSGLASNTNDIVRYTVGTYMERVHKEVYQPDGRWNYGDEPVRPDGIQTLTVNGRADIWPSWYNSANSGVSKETLVFNRYNYLLASSCTPEDQKISVEVTKTIDPMTGNAIYTVPAPYNRDQNDTCDYTPPQVSLSVSGSTITATVRKGTYDIAGYTLYVNGVEKGGIGLSGDGTITGYTLDGTETSLRFVVSDTSGYTASSDITLTPTTNTSTNTSTTEKTNTEEKTTTDDNGS